ncbi:MAG TPA: hypothetical protein VH040_10685 [Usitatibacter sp.]|nr:hypothetical protein [Usitatibacter sp.]
MAARDELALIAQACLLMTAHLNGDQQHGRRTIYRFDTATMEAIEKLFDDLGNVLASGAITRSSEPEVIQLSPPDTTTDTTTPEFQRFMRSVLPQVAGGRQQ